MRLIDADALKEFIRDNYRREFFGSVLWNILDDMPTAYNVEKVVAELEEFVEINEGKYKRYKHHPMVYEYERSYAQVVAYKHAIDIVRKGGVE